MRHCRGHPRFAVDAAPALAVGNACSARQKCETQCTPPAVPESRFGTEKRSRTLPGRLRIADSVPAAVLRQLHQRCREGAGDSGDHTAFPLCVRFFAARLWVSAARRGPLVASRLVTPLPTTAVGVRSLSSILQSLARAARSFLRYALLPHRQINRFTDADNYILEKKCLDAKQIPRSLARSSDAVGLKSSSCPSARIFASRYLQTPPHGDALALRYLSPPSGWDGTCTRQLPNMRGVPKKGPHEWCGPKHIAEGPIAASQFWPKFSECLLSLSSRKAR